jgi:glucose-6-phosphate isomerase
MSKDLFELDSVKKLKGDYEKIKGKHCRDLLSDSSRNEKLVFSNGDIMMDYSHQKINDEILNDLVAVAKEQKVKEKFDELFKGDKVNNTEVRSVLHYALRADRSKSLMVDGKDVIKGVWEVLDRIKEFSNKVRKGEFKGYTGKPLKNFISIGIGGSYLGVDCVYNAIKDAPEYKDKIKGFNLRFIANVCPLDQKRALEGLDLEETLIIIVSKTFTTAETSLNARNCKNIVLDYYKNKGVKLNDEETKKIVAHHFCAVSTALDLTEKFGIDKNNVFGFWDWVGGRYSVWSAVGALPLSLYFSYDVFEEVLKGARKIDEEVINCKDLRKCMPVMFGLVGWYDVQILDLDTRVILPYSQALCKFANHIQQLDMESNGKKVNKYTNKITTYECGPKVFGEPGTNGQHSFYQLIHQGRRCCCEFIGCCRPQYDCHFNGEKVSSHEELMSNFFAQPDALAIGKFTNEDLKDIPDNLKAHKTFTGDRPSLSILMKELTAKTIGELVALYEYRVMTEGFVLNINSFDQWGVQLGKTTANGVRDVFADRDTAKFEEKYKSKFNSSTFGLMKFFIENKKK